MLNYVWIGLIFLGLAAAISTDVSEQASNKYQKGKPVQAELRIADTVETTNSLANKKAVVTVNAKTFSSFYNEKVAHSVSFEAQLSAKNKNGFYQVLILTDDTSPKIWKKMAKVNGNENDLNAKVKIEKRLSSNVYKCQIVLEEISIVKIKEVTNAVLDYAETAVKIALGLIGIMALWLGIMKIAEESGLINHLASGLKPITKFLFPEIPGDHPAMGAMIMNISANFLGLGNAATPFGLKAMEELDKLNPEKGTASNAMCTFLAINTAGMTLIPATAIALRASAGSAEPAIIIGTSLVGSACATIVGITTAKILEKFPIDAKDFFAWLKGNSKFILTIVSILLIAILSMTTNLLSPLKYMFSFITPEAFKNFIQFVSAVAIPTIIAIFLLFGFIKKVKVYEVFVEGAKEGFNVAIRIIPYLVAMLMAIGIFRAGGAMDWLIFTLRPFTSLIGLPPESLPMAIMRPLSGSGSLGIMAETMAVHGPDSFIGILTSTFFGSSETTFYVLAVYFGAVNIKRTRHALAAGLMADIAGVLGALFIVKLLFG
ncbi:MAG: nucleoside recognition protein [Ignavibacteria bacterium CG_4_8_14_3_um_filter_37_9]|nr:spore maturation protein [Ignavibacteria bacterium]OIO19981.1 MAG: nucleoside recognition protein [Ignavibacteria bacterium CG1_02_37_35]PIS44770.1 MAG: nucleoside recognition protein [Ignavibacteria bacterium CG08_land_8_20_14_0_20_37_9]PIW99151.1 MAG: nucleoside recognition protein [Ignavibacteria bacterium CG_4_8_14_3_um_filter_37_9]PIX94016.1 MAG: nucleoside recognition protein [Ignavibacteria bacterium CG_4_10_14_3_um_filter_37_18]